MGRGPTLRWRRKKARIVGRKNGSLTETTAWSMVCSSSARARALEFRAEPAQHFSPAPWKDPRVCIPLGAISRPFPPSLGFSDSTHRLVSSSAQVAYPMETTAKEVVTKEVGETKRSGRGGGGRRTGRVGDLASTPSRPTPGGFGPVAPRLSSGPGQRMPLAFPNPCLLGHHPASSTCVATTIINPLDDLLATAGQHVEPRRPALRTCATTAMTILDKALFCTRLAF